MEVAPRAFRREGLASRGAPFAIASVAGLLVFLLAGPAHDPVLAAEAVGGVLALFAIVAIAPLDRLPPAADLLPPLLFLGLVASLRYRMGVESDSALAVSMAPYFLLPVFWVALHGTRWQLALMIAVITVVRFGPAIEHGFERGELGYSFSAVLVISVICVVVQQVVRSDRELAATLRRILDALPVGYLIVDGATVVYANQSLAMSLGHASRDVLIGTRAPIAGELPSGHETRMAHADGGEVLFRIEARWMELDHRRVIGAVLVDVTDERMLEAAEVEMRASVAEERAQLLAVFAAVDDGVVVLDAQHRGVYANPAYCEMFSLSPDKVRGLPREAFLAHTAQLSDDPKGFARRFETIDDHGEEAIELEFARPRRRVLRRSVTPIQLPGGAGFLVVWRDVTSDRDLISERERQANTDPLTGLPNRRGAGEALAREVARARRQQSPLAVAMLDIDHFKRINDHNGHPAGDHVLVVIAGVLTAQMRITDTAARWGGEEFLVVLPGAIDAARGYCERVRAALAELEIARVGRITISAGIAQLGADETIEQAIARADRHLYAAKEAGRDRIADSLGHASASSSVVIDG